MTTTTLSKSNTNREEERFEMNITLIPSRIPEKNKWTDKQTDSKITILLFGFYFPAAPSFVSL